MKAARKRRTHKKAAARASPTPELPDDLLLLLIAKWRLARLNAQLVWASGDLVTRFGTKDDSLDQDAADGEGASKHLDEVQRLSVFLADGSLPCSVRGACELLRVATEIIGRQITHPGTKLADGPVLEIVQAVTQALDLLPYDTAIGPDAACR